MQIQVPDLESLQKRVADQGRIILDMDSRLEAQKKRIAELEKLVEAYRVVTLDMMNLMGLPE